MTDTCGCAQHKQMEFSFAVKKQGESSVQAPEQILQIKDPDHPFSWSAAKEWSVTLIACYVTFIIGFNAIALTAAVSQTNATFNIADAAFPNSVWPVTAWNTRGALAPMVVLPIMEEHGTRLGYLTTYIIFLLFVIPQAVAQNFATFIICRFFAGCCGTVLQDAMDGIVADIWAKATERSLPVSCYIFALLAGVRQDLSLVGRLCTGWIGDGCYPLLQVCEK
jgi:MFS family permease